MPMLNTLDVASTASARQRPAGSWAQFIGVGALKGRESYYCGATRCYSWHRMKQKAVFFGKEFNSSEIVTRSRKRNACPAQNACAIIKLQRKAKHLSKLRISIVEYLNTAPLVWGFTNGPLAGRYELSFTVPSLCAEALRTGAVDVAIIPAIEYQRMDGLVVLPEMSIAAKRDVRSLLLLSKKPIEQAQRIALDSSSRSTQALVRILCAGRWKISPEFVQAAPDPSVMLTSADAALVIGDPALRIAARLDELAGKSASGEFCCGGDRKSVV